MSETNAGSSSLHEEDSAPVSSTDTLGTSSGVSPTMMDRRASPEQPTPAPQGPQASSSPPQLATWSSRTQPIEAQGPGVQAPAVARSSSSSRAAVTPSEPRRSPSVSAPLSTLPGPETHLLSSASSSAQDPSRTTGKGVPTPGSPRHHAAALLRTETVPTTTSFSDDSPSLAGSLGATTGTPSATHLRKTWCDDALSTKPSLQPEMQLSPHQVLHGAHRGELASTEAAMAGLPRPDAEEEMTGAEERGLIALGSDGDDGLHQGLMLPNQAEIGGLRRTIVVAAVGSDKKLVGGRGIAGKLGESDLTPTSSSCPPGEEPATLVSDASRRRSGTHPGPSSRSHGPSRGGFSTIDAHPAHPDPSASIFGSDLGPMERPRSPGLPDPSMTWESSVSIDPDADPAVPGGDTGLRGAPASVPADLHFTDGHLVLTPEIVSQPTHESQRRHPHRRQPPDSSTRSTRPMHPSATSVQRPRTAEAHAPRLSSGLRRRRSWGGGRSSLASSEAEYPLIEAFYRPQHRLNPHHRQPGHLRQDGSGLGRSGGGGGSSGPMEPEAPGGRLGGAEGGREERGMAGLELAVQGLRLEPSVLGGLGAMIDPGSSQEEAGPAPLQTEQRRLGSQDNSDMGDGEVGSSTTHEPSRLIGGRSSGIDPFHWPKSGQPTRAEGEATCTEEPRFSPRTASTLRSMHLGDRGSVTVDAQLYFGNPAPLGTPPHGQSLSPITAVATDRRSYGGGGGGDAVPSQQERGMRRELAGLTRRMAGMGVGDTGGRQNEGLVGVRSIGSSTLPDNKMETNMLQDPPSAAASADPVSTSGPIPRSVLPDDLVDEAVSHVPTAAPTRERKPVSEEPGVTGYIRSSAAGPTSSLNASSPRSEGPEPRNAADNPRMPTKHPSDHGALSAGNGASPLSHARFAPHAQAPSQNRAQDQAVISPNYFAVASDSDHEGIRQQRQQHATRQFAGDGVRRASGWGARSRSLSGGRGKRKSEDPHGRRVLDHGMDRMDTTIEGSSSSSSLMAPRHPSSRRTDSFDARLHASTRWRGRRATTESLDALAGSTAHRFAWGTLGQDPFDGLRPWGPGAVAPTYALHDPLLFAGPSLASGRPQQRSLDDGTASRSDSTVPHAVRPWRSLPASPLSTSPPPATLRLVPDTAGGAAGWQQASNSPPRPATTTTTSPTTLFLASQLVGEVGRTAQQLARVGGGAASLRFDRPFAEPRLVAAAEGVEAIRAAMATAATAAVGWVQERRGSGRRPRAASAGMVVEGRLLPPPPADELEAGPQDQQLPAGPVVPITLGFDVYPDPLSAGGASSWRLAVGPSTTAAGAPPLILECVMTVGLGVLFGVRIPATLAAHPNATASVPPPRSTGSGGAAAAGPLPIAQTAITLTHRAQQGAAEQLSAFGGQLERELETRLAGHRERIVGSGGGMRVEMEVGRGVVEVAVWLPVWRREV
ncbi:hypothetical protein HDU96_006854 [Phlyctochytrium bullatum]|nr:hypothetical protein HDU96_006854 [Phlyctochytrium bullatum]